MAFHAQTLHTKFSSRTRTKPSYTAHFDILKFDILTGSESGWGSGWDSGWNEVFKKVLTGSLPPFFAHLLYPGAFSLVSTDQEPGEGYGEGWSELFVHCKKEFHHERIYYDAEFLQI